MARESRLDIVLDLKGGQAFRDQMKQNMDETKRLERDMALLDSRFEAGKISQEDYAARAAELQSSMKDVSRETEALSEVLSQNGESWGLNSNEIDKHAAALARAEIKQNQASASIGGLNMNINQLGRLLPPNMRNALRMGTILGRMGEQAGGAAAGANAAAGGINAAGKAAIGMSGWIGIAAIALGVLASAYKKAQQNNENMREAMEKKGEDAMVTASAAAALDLPPQFYNMFREMDRYLGLTEDTTISAYKNMRDVIEKSIKTSEEYSKAQKDVEFWTKKVSEAKADGSEEAINLSYYEDQLVQATDRMNSINNDAINTIKGLGVELIDASGEARDLHDIFIELIKAFGDVDDPIEVARIGTILFGESQKELYKLTGKSREEIELLIESLKKYTDATTASENLKGFAARKKYLDESQNELEKSLAAELKALDKQQKAGNISEEEARKRRKEAEEKNLEARLDLLANFYDVANKKERAFVLKRSDLLTDTSVAGLLSLIETLHDPLKGIKTPEQIYTAEELLRDLQQRVIQSPTSHYVFQGPIPQQYINLMLDGAIIGTSMFDYNQAEYVRLNGATK